MTDSRFDMIIIGGGPNGLECGAYLAKAGQVTEDGLWELSQHCGL